MISIIIYNCTVFLLREFGYVSSDCMQLKKTSYTVNSCMVSLLCEFLCVSLVPGCRRMFLNKLNSWKVCFQCDPAYGTLSFWHYLGNRGKSSVFFEIQHVLLCELSYGISDHLDEQMIWNILYNCRVFSCVNSAMSLQLNSSWKRLRTQWTVIWFLSCVSSYVYL